ncbi:MAG: hypothetical protein Q9167_002153 [Letrouitia subvulpina]
MCICSIPELLAARPDAQHEIRQMQDLVRQYSVLPSPPFGIESATSRPSGSRKHVVVLTGVTGAFGCHVLGLLLKKDIQEVICLVKATNDDEAQKMVLNALTAYGQNASTTPGPESTMQKATLTSVVVNLDTLDLGLSQERYQGIAARITHVGHMAWRTASRLDSPLESFISDIKGLTYLLALSASFPRGQAPPRFLFASSTSTVANTPSVEYPIREVISTKPEHAAQLAYSRSKWVAEGICSAVHHSTSRLKNRIWILRVGQLCGNVEQGVWDLQDPWPLMMAAIQRTSAIPTLKNERINWLPVDVAAKVAHHIGSWRGGIKDWDGKCPVFHLVDQSSQITWTDLLRWIRSIEWDCCEALPPVDWLHRIESLGGYPKWWVAAWRVAYGETNSARELPFYETWKTANASVHIEHPRQIRENHFRRMWEWIRYQMQHLDQ